MSTSFKEKYQSKLQQLVTEIQNDPDNTTAGDHSTGTQQSFILSAVHHLIETDKTNALMSVLSETFGEELSNM
jgi:hypothetical protein